MWYDDVSSLSPKFQFAMDHGLAGVGMWQADALDYSNKTQVEEMWGIMPQKRTAAATKDNTSYKEETDLKWRRENVRIIQV